MNQPAPTTTASRRQRLLDYLTANPGSTRGQLVKAGVASEWSVDARTKRMADCGELEKRNGKWFALVEKTAMRYTHTKASEEKRQQRIREVLAQKAANALPPLPPQAQACRRVICLLDAKPQKAANNGGKQKHHIRAGGYVEHKLHL